MKIETQILEDHQAKLTVEVEPERLESMKHRAAGKIARKVKIPGFRPGKAPYAVILRTVGEPAVLEEALEMVVDDIYPAVIKDAQIEVYGPGRLDNVASMDPLTLEFVVPLEPEVTLGDYRSIRKPYEPEPVSDQDVEDMLQRLREREAVIEPVERPAQEGDLVSVKLSAERKSPAEDQDPTLIIERTAALIIRPESEGESENKAAEWPYPGFSRRLVGLTAGDDLHFDYIYPEDSSIDSYRSVEAIFHLQVENVKARRIPEADDDFAATLGEFENLAELSASIRETLEKQSQEAYNEDYDEDVLKIAIEQTSYKYPPQMLDNEIEQVIHSLQHRLEQQRLDLDLYMKSRDMDMDGLRAEVTPVAESRLKRGLFLYELGKAEGIEVQPEELQSEALSTMNYLSQVLPEKDARRLATDKNTRDNLIGNVLADLLSRRTLERFRDICSGKADEVKPEDAAEHTEAPFESVAEADVPVAVAAEESLPQVGITEISEE